MPKEDRNTQLGLEVPCKTHCADRSYSRSFLARRLRVEDCAHAAADRIATVGVELRLLAVLGLIRGLVRIPQSKVDRKASHGLPIVLEIGLMTPPSRQPTRVLGRVGCAGDAAEQEGGEVFAACSA